MLSKMLMKFQFDIQVGGRLRSNPVQEIHDQVDHDLHGPHRDGSHRHGEASRWPPAIIVCRPRLEELVDSFGELLSEGLVAVPRADMERRGPSCAINQQSVIISRHFFETPRPGGGHHCIRGSRPMSHMCGLAKQQGRVPRGRACACFLFPLVFWVGFFSPARPLPLWLVAPLPSPVRSSQPVSSANSPRLGPASCARISPLSPFAQPSALESPRA